MSPIDASALQTAPLPVHVTASSESPPDGAAHAVEIVDQRLGVMLFPAYDRVMAPWIAAAGSWEVAEGWWLDHALAPGMTFVNVGANVGYFAIWAAGIVGPTGRVIAVEPDPVNYALLCENIARRGLAHVTALQAAASDEPGVIRLFRNPTNAGDHRVFDPTIARDAAEAGFEPRDVSSIEVPAIRLDDLLGGEQVHCVMTDTQGWDHHVLRGMRGSLEHWQPHVLCEYKPAWIRSLGEDPLQVLQEYMAMGYGLGVIEAGTPPGSWDAETILKYSDVPGRPHVTLELGVRGHDVTPRATPAEGFWLPESAGRDRWWWLTQATGSLFVRGPAGVAVDVTLDLLPAPGVDVDATIGDHAVRSSGPVTVTVGLLLGPDGVAELPVAARNPAGDAPDDPRSLFLAARNPVVALASPARRAGRIWRGLLRR